MPFNSYPYFVFLAVAVLGFRLLEKRALTARRLFLLLASYAFYAWWRADFLAQTSFCANWRTARHAVAWD